MATSLPSHPQTDDNELELVDISHCIAQIPADGSRLTSNSNPQLYLYETETTESVNDGNKNSDSRLSGAASSPLTIENENLKDEGIKSLKPLIVSTSASAHSGFSVSPSSLPIIPKNRRRPGSSSDGSKVLMTGTVLQGNGGGSPVEVEVELSGRELERLTSSRNSRVKEKKDVCKCGLTQGPHIVLLSIMSIPAAFFISLVLGFYNLSITWYNLFIYLSEEKSFVHKVTLCPVLVLSFPLTVGASCVSLAMVASVIQVSWFWDSWLSEIVDGEKGFCGWLCNRLCLPDCSPYQLVILDDDGDDDSH